MIPDYLSSYSMWYASYEYYSILEYALVFGMFGGFITGLVVDKFHQKASLLAAAALALISYLLIPQFDGSSRSTHEPWHYYILVVLIFLAGQSASLGIISAVKVNMLNYTTEASPIVISILMSYLCVGIHVESAIRWYIFFGVDTKTYMIGVGVVSFFIYAIGAFVMVVAEEDQDGSQAENKSVIVDKISLSIFIVFEVFQVLLLLMFKLIIKDVVSKPELELILGDGNVDNSLVFRFLSF